jgi:uncharacterized RDD family membrane protein YckC
MVVSTPERVAFEYEIAGVGSRFMAQLIDVLLLLAVLFAFSITAGVVGNVTADGNLALLIFVLVTFLVFIGYFPFCEGIWSGQTLGKRALRIRVLGDRGEPVTLTQVAIRNLVRLVDFLPFFYGVGLITIFIQGGGKRLGDFAAGTVVARERGRIRLKELVAAAETSTRAAAQPAAARPRSIWADQAVQEDAPEGAAQAGDAAQPAPPPTARATPYEDAVRRMDPQLRRFVVAYARRRNELPAARRNQLAEQVGPGLSRLLPAEVAAFGTAAVLDGLAALVYAGIQPAPPPSPLPPPVSRPSNQ